MTKPDQAKKIIKEAFSNYKKPLIACSFGKDSTAILYLIKEVFGKIPCPVLANDTGFWFPEIREFMQKLRRELDLEIIQITRYMPQAKNKPPNCDFCTKNLKLMPSLLAIRGYEADCVFAGVRADENKARGQAKIIEKQKGHDRVHPILDWTEDDVWVYIKSNAIPYCSLYDKGYRSLGCSTCTKPAKEGGNERSGRGPDKEEIMKKLRDIGYW